MLLHLAPEHERMKMDAGLLLNDLKERTLSVLDSAKALDATTDEVLLSRPDPKAWNALECIEQLNRYSDFYLPEIRRRMEESNRKSVNVFREGWLGGRFAKSLMPREPGKLNKMRTFSSMNTIGEVAERVTIRRFIADQKELLKLLEIAEENDLNKVRTSISISKLIKLRLGDTLRVVIYHNQRHMQQALRAAGVHT